MGLSSFRRVLLKRYGGGGTISTAAGETSTSVAEERISKFQRTSLGYMAEKIIHLLDKRCLLYGQVDKDALFGRQKKVSFKILIHETNVQLNLSIQIFGVFLVINLKFKKTVLYLLLMIRVKFFNYL